MKMTTKALAEFTSALKYKKLSGRSVEMAKRCMQSAVPGNRPPVSSGRPF